MDTSVTVLDNTKTEQIIVDITLPVEDLEAVYAGRYRYVRARSLDGRWVHLPVMKLRRFLTHQGISGRFALTVTAEHTLDQVKRLA